MVLPNQPANWGNYYARYPNLFQGSWKSGSSQPRMESPHKGVWYLRHGFLHPSNYLITACSAMGWNQIPVEQLAYYPPVLLLQYFDHRLHRHPVLETRNCDHSTKDDDEAVDVGCSYVFILHGLLFPFVGLFPTNLVSGGQRCFSCQIWNHELAHGPFAGSCLYHQWYRCYPCRILWVDIFRLETAY